MQLSSDYFYIPIPNLLPPLETIFSPNFPQEPWGCSSEEESGKEGKVFGIGLSRRRTPSSSGIFARVHSASRLARVRNRLGSVNSRSSTWRLSWPARQLGLVTRYHYNILIPMFLALSEPFLPLVYHPRSVWSINVKDSLGRGFILINSMRFS